MENNIVLSLQTCKTDSSLIIERIKSPFTISIICHGKIGKHKINIPWPAMPDPIIGGHRRKHR